MKKIYNLVVTSFLCLFITACHYDGDTIVNEKPTPTFGVVIEELTAKDVSFYNDPNDVTTLGFRKDKADIPYIRFDSKTAELLNGYFSQCYEFSAVAADTTKVTITNTKRNTTAVVDLTKHTITFENYDLFFQKNNDEAGPYMDPTGCRGSDYLKITDYSNIAGQSITLSWATQDIGVVIWKSADSYNLALPLQTFNDVFLSQGSYPNIIYNGNYLYFADKDFLDASEATDKGYWKTGNQSGTRSEALAEFCYNELCLNFDLNYGLKAIHGIEKFADFDAYFKKTGTRDSLKSTNAAEFAKALKDVCVFYFGDGHSGYNKNSHYLAKDLAIPLTHTPASSVAYNLAYDTYPVKRGTSGSIPAYVTSGNTAIVRFDHFTFKHRSRAEVVKAAGELSGVINSYVDKEEEKYDTVALIYYVNSLIQEDSNIKNVVLDLSCNGGGANHSAAVVLAWMLGKCDFYFTNPITGAKWSITYNADVNMNGTYNEANDYLKDKNLFCLISPLSFSCGNLVPAMLKASDRVTILGVASSGGSSCVQNSSTADGSVIQMSSKNVMSISKNGSNYDIDKGVEPHYFINIPENFYKAATINELVNNINSGKLAVSTSNS